MNYLAECASFLREYWRHFHATGSVLPSSRFLARAMTAEIRPPRPPARILEVGPGTGAVTAEIVRRLIPGDQLDIVEVNSTFIAFLQRRFEEEEPFRSRRDQVRLIHGPVQDLPGEAVYDFIISSLPLNGFPPDLVRDIYAVFNRVLKPGGTLTYFEYALIRHLEMPFVTRRERQRLHEVTRIVTGYIRSCQYRRDFVPINVPPAIARHLHLKPANGTDRG